MHNVASSQVRVDGLIRGPTSAWHVTSERWEHGAASRRIRQLRALIGPHNVQTRTVTMLDGATLQRRTETVICYPSSARVPPPMPERPKARARTVTVWP